MSTTMSNALSELEIAGNANPITKLRAACQWHLGDREWADRLVEWAEEAGFDVSVKKAEPEPGKYYLVSGRVIGDDEDSCKVFQAADEDEAMALFNAFLTAQEPPGDDIETTVTGVCVSDAPIEVTYSAG